MRLEVRCCCRPEKLLGWMETPLPVSPGAWITFLARPIARPIGSAGMEILSACRVSLQAEWISLPDRSRHLALKSEETPVETLRRILEFTENVP